MFDWLHNWLFGDDDTANQEVTVNPANGLPMTGGLDIAGNPFGTDSSQHDLFEDAGGTGIDTTGVGWDSTASGIDWESSSIGCDWSSSGYDPFDSTSSFSSGIDDWSNSSSSFDEEW